MEALLRCEVAAIWLREKGILLNFSQATCFYHDDILPLLTV